MEKLEVKGREEFLGKEIPIVEGGFKEGQRVVLTKTVAEIHDIGLGKINKKINDYIDGFEIGTTLLDFKNTKENLVLFFNNIYSKQSIANSNNIYVLSEDGYMLLVRLMNTVEDKRIGEQFREAYFGTKEVVEEPVSCEVVSDEEIQEIPVSYEEPVNNVQTISSREVAEMMETRHDNLMNKIEKHTEILEKVTDLKIKVSDLWQLSSYRDNTGRTLKEYQVTKKGCEFLAHKTTGEKGDIFTVKYMNKFEEMEQYIKEQEPKMPTTYKEALNKMKSH